MEVMQYLKEEFAEEKEAAAQHLKDGVEEVMGENLVARRPRRHSNGGTTAAAAEEGDNRIVDFSLDAKAAGAVEEEGAGDNIEDMSKNSVYLDQSAGALLEGSDEEKLPQVEDLSAKVKDVDIQKILSAVISGKSMEILKEETFLSSSTLPLSTKPGEEDGTASPGPIKNENGHLKINIIDESDEEVLELEFERAVEKMHTHEYNMYCPNCSNRITKVILRKRKREERTKPQDLLGCLSCLSIFVPKGNLLNHLKIFGTRNKPDNSQISQQQNPSLAPGSTVQQPSGVGPSGNINNGSALGKGISNVDGSASNGSLIIDIPDKIGETTEGRRHPTEPLGEIEEGPDIIDGQYPGAAVQSPPEQRPVPTENTQMENIPDASRPLIAKRASSSRSLEILKSIVYGGLMELVASLSIVSSAAASHATTLNTVALGLANIIGGILVLFHNLKELRYEDSEEAEGEKESRYLKLLGRKENFIVHTVFVVLSYIVFGLVPPAVFGFTFRATDDQDFKLVAVAGASLLSILILAIAKVITRRQHTFMAYLKTVVYYVTGAATASGIAYAAGHLLERFMNDLGWFDAKPGEHVLVPGDKIWASF